MQKKSRFAACEPCRLMKQSCNHESPCSRCCLRGTADDCVYRERPFKKNRVGNSLSRPPVTPVASSIKTGPSSSSTKSSAGDKRYPNPGYLGSSSHATIYNHLLWDTDVPLEPLPDSPAPEDGLLRYDRLRSTGSRGACILDDIVSSIDVNAASNLVSFWLAKGVNLVLGGLMLPSSNTAAKRLLLSARSSHTTSQLASRLSERSGQPLSLPRDAKISDYVNQFVGDTSRWEMIVIWLIAAGRATFEVPFFPPLYVQQDERRRLQRSLLSLADRCLEYVLSLDCLSDMQLVCQYENWILYTMVDGDQSFQSWRRLGDIISSLMFLGYHEEIKDDGATPLFLIELRRAMCARIFSDDKNVAVFLGRPPRLSSTFCCFQLPQYPLDQVEKMQAIQSGVVILDHLNFDPTQAITYCTSIRWTALCAFLKEQALEAHRCTNATALDKTQRASIRRSAETLWSNLPSHLRLDGSLQTHKHRTPFEQDFLINARLTYLQIFCLLEVREFLEHASQEVYFPPEVVFVAQEMLSLVVEAMVLRDRLLNSGTGLVWKVVHYGLPAAGIVALHLLQLCLRSDDKARCAKVVQDLSTFVSEIQMEGVVLVGEPNYDLLHSAASSLKIFLRKLLSSAAAVGDRAASVESTRPSSPPLEETLDMVASSSGMNTDALGYEPEFWRWLEDYSMASLQNIL